MVMYTIATTYTSSIGYIYDTFSETTYSTETDITTMTVTQSDGGFAVDTFVTTSTWIMTDVSLEEIPTSTSYGTPFTISAVESYTFLTPPSGTVPTPGCTLSSIVPECQSSWDVYESSLWKPLPTMPPCITTWPVSGPCAISVSQYDSSVNAVSNLRMSAEGSGTPLCTNAVVTGSVCSNLVSAFLFPSPNYMQGPTVDASVAASQLAPGCTVGCQQCRITGESVKLLFWPPKTSSAANATLATVNASSLVTAVGFGTTFTSPTLYISFDTLYASDSCSKVGTTYTNTIVAITRSADLSSIYGKSGPYGAFGSMDFFSTASLNFTDLVVMPVPNSIYNRQPRCCSSYGLYVEDGITVPDNFSCARTLPYAPILSIPPEVFALDPAWHNCVGALNGVYDPPSVLTPQATLAVPTVIAPPTTTAATPAKSASPVTATNTGAPQTTKQATSQSSAAPYSSPSVADPKPVASDSASHSTSEVDTASMADGNSKVGDASPTSPGDVASAIMSVLGASGSESAPNAVPSESVIHPAASAAANSGDLAKTSASSSDNVAAAIMAIFGSISSSTISALQSQVSGNADPPASTTSIPGAAFAIGTQQFTAQSDAPFTIGSAILTAGGAAATVSGGVISVASNVVVIDDSTHAYSAIPAADATTVPDVGSQGADPAAIFTISDQTYTAITGVPITVGSVILTAGGPAATVSGQTISIGSSGVVVDGSTHAYTSIISDGSAAASAIVYSSSGAVITVNSQIYTIAQASNAILIGSKTLSVGASAITIDDEILSAASSGLVVSKSGSSSFLALTATGSQSSAEAKTETFDVDGTAYTAVADPNEPGDLIVDGIATLSLGGPATAIGGHSLSLAASGLAVDGSTTLLSVLQTTEGTKSSSKFGTTSDVISVSSVGGNSGGATGSTAASTSTKKSSSAAGKVFAPCYVLLLGGWLLAFSYR